jgi:hypothetical protein
VPIVVQFAEAFSEVPDDVRTDLISRLREIAGSLDALPRSNGLWESVEVSTLLLDVRAWRFEYRVQLGGKRIVVEHVQFMGR